MTTVFRLFFSQPVLAGPIIERELKVACRKRATFRLRMAAALLGSAVAGFIILITLIVGRGAGMGAGLFFFLAVVGLIFCALEGARQASDALNSEVREGTLGLLFLTDLRGSDVVVGKAAALGISSFQRLLAVFPVLSVALVLGGVTPGEVWRMALVQLNTLFFCLALGMAVSASVREAGRAVAITLALIAVISLGPMAGNGLWQWAAGRELPLLIAGWSPAYSVGPALRENLYQLQPRAFWTSVGLVHLAGWLFLVWASWRAPHIWQEKPEKVRMQNKPAAASVSERLKRGKLLDINPMIWLASRHGVNVRWIWGSILVFGGLGLLLSLFENFTGGVQVSAILIFLAALVLKLSVALQACSNLAEAKMSGAAELLLATPLKVKEIVRGNFLALKRMFLAPALVIGGLLILSLVQTHLLQAGSLVEVWLDWKGGSSLADLAGFLAVYGFTLGLAVLKTATFFADLVALGYLGMWMGWTRKSVNQAFILTILFVLVIPGFLFCVPDLLIDILVIVWAKQRLETQLRQSAAEQYQGPGVWPPPIVSPALPPVLPRPGGG